MVRVLIGPSQGRITTFAVSIDLSLRSLSEIVCLAVRSVKLEIKISDLIGWPMNWCNKIIVCLVIVSLLAFDDVDSIHGPLFNVIHNDDLLTGFADLFDLLNLSGGILGWAIFSRFKTTPEHFVDRFETCEMILGVVKQIIV